MSALRVIDRARRHGVTFLPSGSGLRLRADTQPPADLLAEIKSNKAAILRALAPQPLAEVDAFDERAAISQFDGGVPRVWAEGFARMQCAHPPDGMTDKRWLEIIDDAGSFIDQWADRASALGWSTLDVFGAHPTVPEARYDAIGLVPLLRGRPVVAITSETATIQAAPTVQSRYRRRPRADAVAIWELIGGVNDE